MSHSFASSPSLHLHPLWNQIQTILFGKKVFFDLDLFFHSYKSPSTSPFTSVALAVLNYCGPWCAVFLPNSLCWWRPSTGNFFPFSAYHLIPSISTTTLESDSISVFMAVHFILFHRVISESNMTINVRKNMNSKYVLCKYTPEFSFIFSNIHCTTLQAFIGSSTFSEMIKLYIIIYLFSLILCVECHNCLF